MVTCLAHFARLQREGIHDLEVQKPILNVVLQGCCSVVVVSLVCETE